MNKEEFISLAEKIRDGKASEEEKLEFIKVCRIELSEVSKILKDKGVN